MTQGKPDTEGAQTLVLSEADRKALAADIAEQLIVLQTSPVLSLEHAKQLCGKTHVTDRAFWKWVRKWTPRAIVGNERYSRERLLQGLRKESRHQRKVREARK